MSSHRKSPAARAAGRNRRTLSIEHLEAKSLMAGDVAKYSVQLTPDTSHPGQSMLMVQGTPGKDTITAAPKGSQLVLTINGKAAGTYDLGSIGQVVIDGGAGNDTISLKSGKSTLGLPAVLMGGDGNDTLTGGSRGVVLAGGAGNDKLVGTGGVDILVGGDGNDTLTGAAGDDMLLGGSGNDNLNGEKGRDLLTGGDGKNTLAGTKKEDFLASGKLSDANDPWSSSQFDPSKWLASEAGQALQGALSPPWMGQGSGSVSSDALFSIGRELGNALVDNITDWRSHVASRVASDFGITNAQQTLFSVLWGSTVDIPSGQAPGHALIGVDGRPTYYWYEQYGEQLGGYLPPTAFAGMSASAQRDIQLHGPQLRANLSTVMAQARQEIPTQLPHLFQNPSAHVTFDDAAPKGANLMPGATYNMLPGNSPLPGGVDPLMMLYNSYLDYGYMFDTSYGYGGYGTYSTNYNYSPFPAGNTLDPNFFGSYTDPFAGIDNYFGGYSSYDPYGYSSYGLGSSYGSYYDPYSSSYPTYSGGYSSYGSSSGSSYSGYSGGYSSGSGSSGAHVYFDDSIPKW